MKYLKGSIVLFIILALFLGMVTLVVNLNREAQKPGPCETGGCISLKVKLTGESPDYPFNVGNKVGVITILAENPEGTQLSVNCPPEVTVFAQDSTNFKIGTNSEASITCTASVTRWSNFSKSINLQVTQYNK
jgi:hypothetical protein